jgi:hypothetical protein
VLLYYRLTLWELLKLRGITTDGADCLESSISLDTDMEADKFAALLKLNQTGGNVQHPQRGQGVG